jgi:hypothetical protein
MSFTSFTNSAALPYTLGFIVMAAAIGCGAGGLLSGENAAALSMSGGLWVLDARIGDGLFWRAVDRPKERIETARRTYFSAPLAWRRYLLEGLGSPILFVSVLLTGLGYTTITAGLACITAFGIYQWVALDRAWKQTVEIEIPPNGYSDRQQSKTRGQ